MSENINKDKKGDRERGERIQNRGAERGTKDEVANEGKKSQWPTFCVSKNAIPAAACLVLKCVTVCDYQCLS